MRGVNRPIPKGYPGHKNDACPVSDEVHVLTTEERAWIQTFPKIGNAVPVNLARFVADRVLEVIQEDNLRG